MSQEIKCQYYQGAGYVVRRDFGSIRVGIRQGGTGAGRPAGIGFKINHYSAPTPIDLDCIMCGNHADGRTIGAIGPMTGPLCDDCAWWGDGNVTKHAGSVDLDLDMHLRVTESEPACATCLYGVSQCECDQDGYTLIAGVLYDQDGNEVSDVLDGMIAREQEANQ